MGPKIVITKRKKMNAKQTWFGGRHSLGQGFLELLVSHISFLGSGVDQRGMDHDFVPKG